MLFCGKIPLISLMYVTKYHRHNLGYNSFLTHVLQVSFKHGTVSLHQIANINSLPQRNCVPIGNLEQERGDRLMSLEEWCTQAHTACYQNQPTSINVI